MVWNLMEKVESFDQEFLITYKWAMMEGVVGGKNQWAELSVEL